MGNCAVIGGVAVRERNRSKYYERLLGVSQRGDWEGWLRFFLTGVRDQSREAALRAANLQTLREHYHEQLASRRSAKRLAEAVDFLIGNPILTVHGLQGGLKLTDFKTAQRYASDLEEAGILREATGWKRNRLYRANGVLDTIQKPLKWGIFTLSNDLKRGEWMP